MMTANTKATLFLFGFAVVMAAMFWLIEFVVKILGPVPTFGTVLFIAVIAAWFRLRGMFNDD